MHFGENQLSPGSIGISPLPTAHPVALHRQMVRTSIRPAADFTLAMDSSPGFGSDPGDLPCGNALFRLAFASAPQVALLNHATEIYSPAHSSIGTPSPPPKAGAPTVCRHAVSGSFNSPPGVLFHLSLTVLLHYRSLEVFSFGRWSSRLPTGFHVSRGTQEHGPGRLLSLRIRGFHSLWRPFPGSFCWDGAW